MTRFSVIIPTLNEAARLPATLAAARAALPGAQFLVSDGGSTDGTAALAAGAGAMVIRSGGGRGAQLDDALRAAAGEICVLLHADTLLPANAAAAIERALRAERVVGGAFSLRFLPDERPGPALRLLARAINTRSRLWRTATGDQAMFARTAVLRRLGGVPREPLFEDVRLYRALRKAGTVVLLQESVLTSPRLWREFGSAAGIALHLGYRGLHALGVPPRLLSRWYPNVR